MFVCKAPHTIVLTMDLKTTTISATVHHILNVKQGTVLMGDEVCGSKQLNIYESERFHGQGVC